VSQRIKAWGTEVRGLVQTAQESLWERRQVQARVATHRYVTDERYENRLYENLGAGKMQDLENRMRWTCRLEDRRLSLTLALDRRPMTAAGQGRPAGKAGFDALTAAIEGYWQEVRRETVAARLEQHSGGAWANELWGLYEKGPMLKLDDEHSARNQVKQALWISIDPRLADTFVSETLGELGRAASSNLDVHHLPSTDPHRCTACLTADRIVPRAVKALEHARAAFKYELGDKGQLQVRPAEVWAAEIEEQMSGYPIHEGKRSLMPRARHALLDRERLKTFCRAYALDMIERETLQEQAGQKQFVLRVQRKGRGEERLVKLALTPPSLTPSLLEAIHAFTLGKAAPVGGAQEDTLSVEHKWVEQEVKEREWSIIEGHESQIQEIAKLLAPRADPERSREIENAFRRMLYRWEPRIAVLPLSELKAGVQDWLAEQDDLVLEERPERLAEHAAAILLRGSLVSGRDRSRLYRRYEDFIGEKVERYKAAQSQTEQDLGTIMHLVVWPRMKALETQ
jgi:hypothetical protein